MTSIVDFQTKVRQYNENAFDVVEYEIMPLHSDAYPTNDSYNYSFEDIERIINQNQTKIDDLNREIERLTNNATNVDYFVAISSGVLTGIIDSLWVDEFDFEALKADSHKHVNKFIEKYAKIRGYKDNGKGLKGAIEFLEKKFPVDQDNIWKATGISSTKLHHLEDLAHHPTVLGLAASILVQFFRMSIFADKDGKVNVEMIETSKSDFAKTWLPIIITGILKWTIYLVESKKTINDKEIPKPICILMKRLSAAPAVLEILKVADNWFGHLVSDMGGSKNTPGGGMGIPGIFLSLLKEISSLPGINKTCLPQLVSDWYSKDKIDLRAELAIVEYLGKQSVPVIINECFVRTFYFISRLIEEKSHCQSWQSVNWKNIVPWGNRTITRMITISSGTFMALDLADAAVRSAINNGTPQNPKFWADFVLRINIVGLGRFSIAIVDDVRMGVRRNRLRNERIAIMNEQIFLSAAHFYYKEGEIWEEAESALVAVDELYKRAQYVSDLSYKLINDSLKSCSQVSAYLPKVEETNPELLDRINNILNN